VVEAAIHVSTGSIFPHPRNPAGVFPIEAARRNYGTILASGNRTLRNYLLFCYLPRLFLWFWQQSQTDFLKDGKVIPERVEGLNTEDARAIKAAVRFRSCASRGEMGCGTILAGAGGWASSPIDSGGYCTAPSIWPWATPGPINR